MADVVEIRTGGTRGSVQERGAIKVESVIGSDDGRSSWAAQPALDLTQPEHMRALRPQHCDADVIEDEAAYARDDLLGQVRESQLSDPACECAYPITL